MNENKQTVAELQEVFAHLGDPDFVERVNAYEDKRLERERENYGFEVWSAFVKFWGEDYKQFPEWYRKMFATRFGKKLAVFARAKKYIKSGLNGDWRVYYVLSLKRFGVFIEIKNEDLRTAKELFIKAVNEVIPKF